MPRRQFQPRNSNLVERKIAEFVEWKGKLEITEYGQMLLAQKRQLKREEAAMPEWMARLNRKTTLRFFSLVDMLKAKERKYAMAMRMGKPERMKQLDGEIRQLKARIALIVSRN